MKKLLLALLGFMVWDSAQAGEGKYPDIAAVPGWDTLAPVVAQKGDWPWWRGPGSDNIAPAGVKPPTVWGAESGIQWKVTLPGLGHSSPLLCGKKMYVTSGDIGQGIIWLLSLDQASGQTAWQCEIYKGPVAKMHKDNSLASSTPAFDGASIFVPYQTDKTMGLAAVDPDGKVLWRTVVAPYTCVQGYSASPVFYKSLVIMPVEAQEDSRMVAVHRGTGKVVWRNTMRKIKESYASPLVAHVAGRDQLLLIGGETTRAFDPASGTLLWECEGPSTFCGATPVVDQDTVYVTGGYPKRVLMAIRADGSGDVTATHVKWQSDKKAGYVPSPVLYEGLLYAVNDQGLMRCYDATDGVVVWEEPLSNPFYSSPVIAGGLLYLFDRKGQGVVMKSGRDKQTVAVNTLPEGVFASPVFKGKRMYLRTLGALYCIGE